MAYLNKVFLIGNLTRNPELRVTPKGTAICSFSLAVNRQFRDEGGNAREEVTYVDIEAWGKQAELCSKYLAKGSPCMVEGRLRLDSWEDRQSGQKRSKLKVVLDNVQFLSRAPSSASGAQEGQEQQEGEHSAPQARREPAAAAPAPRTPAPQRQLPPPPPLEDDVPF